MSNDTCFSEPRASNVFMTRVHTRYCGLLVRGLHVEKQKVICVTSCIMPAGCRPCSKQNCMLNRATGLHCRMRADIFRSPTRESRINSSLAAIFQPSFCSPSYILFYQVKETKTELVHSVHYIIYAQ